MAGIVQNIVEGRAAAFDLPAGEHMPGQAPAVHVEHSPASNELRLPLKESIAITTFIMFLSFIADFSKSLRISYKISTVIIAKNNP